MAFILFYFLISGLLVARPLSYCLQSEQQSHEKNSAGSEFRYHKSRQNLLRILAEASHGSIYKYPSYNLRHSQHKIIEGLRFRVLVQF